MQRSAHKLLTAFLAAWMPFCCCQARAAVGVAVRQATVANAAAHADAPTGPACCSQGPGVAADSCCAVNTGKSPADGNSKQAPGNCCVSCKDRVLPVAPPILGPDTVGVEIWIPALQLTVLSDASLVATPSLCDGQSTGPPGSRPGRTVLQQTCILLV